MSEKNSAHSVIINIPRPRTLIRKSACDVKKLETKKKIRDKTKTVQKPSDNTLQTYSLPGDKPLQIHAFKKDDLLLLHRLYAKKQESNKHKQRAEIKLHEKYKAINTDLRNRLHIEDPPDDVCAVTDIDDAYFRYLNSHPPTQHIPLYKTLKFKFHERLRMRQELGYRLDCILFIEQNNRKELRKYKCSVDKYMNKVKEFDEFIAEDYQKSMESLKNCAALAVLLNAKVSLKENLANSEFFIQSRLIGLDYMYFMQLKYGRFLYYLSPPSWRAKHREFAHSVEIEAKGFDLGTSSEEDTFNVIFENMQKECSSGLIKPVLYFSHPDDLITMFESMEKQLLHHFIHVTLLASRAMKLKKDLQNLRSKMEQDTVLVAHFIEDFVKLVDFCEGKETHLKANFMKILYGLFYDSVAATDVLELQMHLELCFEKLYAEQPSNMRIVSTAKALEKMYMEYSFKLDSFTNDKVKMAMNKCIEKENKKTKLAHIAARELHMFNRLEHALLRAFEKRYLNAVSHPLPVVKVPSFRRLKHKSSKTVVRASCQRWLTEAEIEYLYLFTNWTENEDPVHYLKSLTMTNKNNFV